MIRSLIKYSIAFLSVYSGVIHLLRWIRRSGGTSLQIVHYHQVRPKDRKAFERQLQYYQRKYDIISMSEAVKLLTRKTDALKGNSRRYLVVTFDDGFKDNVEVAAPILERYEIPACFFIVTDFISIKPQDREKLELFAKERFYIPTPEVNMNWEDIRTLIQKGFELGSHTRTHRRLSSLPIETVADELVESRQCIETHTGQSARHFAWPFGTANDFHPDFRELVREQGYVSCCSGIRGINDSRSDVFYLYRDHIQAHWPLYLVRFFLSRR
jgi:peptidoglycan/xylan/chitin deacetylase (PgdA/CDA1 family)